MDKKTLSNYGWIVVLVLILAVLLAVATPFGDFIKASVQSVVGGFFDTNNSAIDTIDKGQPNEPNVSPDACLHENIEVRNKKMATCTAGGYSGDDVCKDCGTTVKTGSPTGKLSHTIVKIDAVEATCEKEGHTEGEKCSSCGLELVASTKIDALGHQWGEAVIIKNATCTEVGISRINCEREGCNAHQEDVEIPKKAHTTVTVKGTAATCTTAGLSDGTKCTSCNQTIKEQTTIAKLGHNIVKDAAKTPTCTSTGLTEGEHCTRCNYKVQQNVIAQLGHDWIEDKAKAATCTETGLTAGKHCSRCSEKVAQTVISALGHTEVKDNAVTPTCTTAGKTEGKHCSVCNEILVAQTTVPAKGHTDKIVAAVAPTCTSSGLTEGVNCSVCNSVLIEQDVIPANGHKPVTDAEVKPTCTATGLTEGSHCSVCRGVLTAQEVVPALGHIEVKDNAVTPTCTTAGKTEGKHCSRCNAVLVAQTTVPATGHTYETPTYTWTGTTVCKASRVCSGCGNVESQNGTITSAVTTVAKCTTAGVRTYTAKFSNTAFTTQTKTESISATGHTTATFESNRATCTADGYTDGTYCSVCGVTLSGHQYEAKLGHDIQEIITASTCHKSGETKEVCKRDGCNYNKITTIPQLSCNIILTENISATCTENGYAKYECTRCECCVYEDFFPPLGHYDDNSDNHCDDCGKIMKEVDGLGDVSVDDPDMEVTYDPDTGNAGGFVPPSDDEEEPFDIPVEELPETITVNYGKFESNTTYTPGQYATVEYIENVITVKQPVDNNAYNMAWWYITKDGDGNILSTTAETKSLAKLPKSHDGITFSTYIVYSLDSTKTLSMNGVDSNAIWYASIINSTDDTLENAIYLAAVAQKQHGFDVHVAKWNGTQYIDQGKDADIDAVTCFTKSTPVTKTKQVLVSAPSSETTYTYVPVGQLIAEKDMTWREWLISDYNTTGYTSPIIKTKSFEDVSLDDVIDEDVEYGFLAYELSGTWKFNEKINILTALSQEITFVSNHTEYKKMEICIRGADDIHLQYFNVIGDMILPYSAYDDYESKWSEYNDKMVDFGNAPQSVSQEFYEWFTANATKQEYVLTGEWLFNETLIIDKPIEQPINFIAFTYDNDGYRCDGFNIYQNKYDRFTEDIVLFYEVFGASETWDSKYEDGWISNGNRYINFGLTQQSVSKEFYEWFTSNAQPCLSGTWVFNENANLYSNADIIQQINFATANPMSSNETWSYTQMKMLSIGLFYTRQQDGQDMNVAHDISSEWYWGTDIFKTIDFGTEPQPVSIEFYNWFTNNATKEKIRATIDLSLYGLGTHEISADKGMTWIEWIKSPYNTIGFSLKYNTSYSGYSLMYYSQDAILYNKQTGNEVYLSNEILNNTHYTVSHNSGG